MKTSRCPTKEMIADALTKPIQGEQFRVLRDMLLGYIWNNFDYNFHLITLLIMYSKELILTKFWNSFFLFFLIFFEVCIVNTVYIDKFRGSNTSRAVLLTPGAGGYCSPKGFCLCDAMHVEAIFIRRVPIRGVVFFKLGVNCITTSRCFSFWELAD